MAVAYGRDPSRYLPDYDTQVPRQHHFSPYANNGGSVVALSGDDFSLIAADTRLSTGFSIYTRDQEKLFTLSPNTVLGCTGCWCDILTLTRVVAARTQMYQHEHHKDMSTPAVAQMLSTMLYHKRFFPYYIGNVLAGLDSDGKGVIYRYDPVGHMEENKFFATGSSGALLQPLLDNQIGYQNQENVIEVKLTKEKAVAIAKDVFISAAERDIYTGDAITIKIITQDGIETEKFELRRD
ncbi:proteasome subunit beta type-1-like [Copidosoma floridanum]|uniref:proteasome subunit beta type-1-like n=1 Tax=Copidosoma floridanum TaxID=29053 RepID=UPI0006C95F85|nr:proteasome subunit beta type-1-like [Copidosoma floridanum]XP_014218912.1 proteasome subunit beta type-1-like [Copidosoma floridanum]